MIVSHRRRFVFCHVPKAAGESVTEALEPHLGWDDVVLGGTAGEVFTQRYRQRFGLGKHSSVGEIREVVGEEIWRRYLTFAVVRDPVDRMVSLYSYLGVTKWRADLNRLRRGLPPWPRSTTAHPWLWPEMKAFRDSRSFSEFIRHWLLDHGQLARPQFATLGCDAVGEPMVDVVLRYERLDQEFARLVDRIGLPPTSLPHRNRTSGKKPTASADDRAFLATRYAADFEAFGYPPA